jgi:hypothetical protein
MPSQSLEGSTCQDYTLASQRLTHRASSGYGHAKQHYAMSPPPYCLLPVSYMCIEGSVAAKWNGKEVVAI